MDSVNSRTIHTSISLLLQQAAFLGSRGRIREALERYRQILAREPRNFGVLHDVGILCAEAGALQDAEHFLARACEVQPRNAGAHFNHGLILQDLKRYDEALSSYDKALRLKPDFTEAHNNCGNVLHDIGCYEEAAKSFDKALSFNPGSAEIHNNKGNALEKLNRYDEALASCDLALVLKADYAEAHNNRGIVLKDLQCYDEALACYDRALALKPDYADAYYNRGIVLTELQRYDEALANFDQAIAYKPDYPDAYNGKSLLLLLLGNFKEAWPLHEWRWRTGHFRQELRGFDQPLWLGAEPLAGRIILLRAEQGLGDIIQFVRYVPMVEAVGGKVILEAPGSLIPLLKTLDSACTLVARGEALPDFDLHCPLMSLPLAFGTTLGTIPVARSYLSADPQRSAQWARRIEEYEGFKVGLVWAGGRRPGQAGVIDLRRSLPLSSFAVLGDVPGVRFFSLQIGPPASQLAELRQARWGGPQITDVTDNIHDWADTAALVDNLDLVISCDTSTAHLAAALGKPTWILNRYDTCWRWLLEREDSPWYPTVRLFRQPCHGDWTSALNRVKAELLRLTEAQRA